MSDLAGRIIAVELLDATRTAAPGLLEWQQVAAALDSARRHCTSAVEVGETVEAIDYAEAAAVLRRMLPAAMAS